jgi:hypothetical protein
MEARPSEHHLPPAPPAPPAPPPLTASARARLLASARRAAAVRASIIGDSECLPCAVGARKLTYADATAAGRASSLVEAPLARLVLPQLANAHTHTSQAGAQSGAFLEEARAVAAETLGAGAREDALIFVRGCGRGRGRGRPARAAQAARRRRGRQ